MRTITALPNARIPLGRQGENEAARVVWPGIAETYRTLYGEGIFALGAQRSDETEAHPAALTREGDNLIWVVTAEDTAAAGIGRAELQYLVGETIAKSQTWTTEVYRALAPVAPGGEPGAAWYAAVQAQIGDLNALTTRAKDNLVAAINEAAKSGGGGGTAAEVEMRVEDGYIQYTSDGGATWENLIALEALKGEDGKDGEPGKDGAAGSPGADGYSPSAKVEQTATGATITITDKDGTTTASVTNGKDGAPGAKGEKGDKGDKGDTGATGATGAQGDPGEDYTLTEDDKSEIAALAAALVPSGGGGEWRLAGTAKAESPGMALEVSGFNAKHILVSLYASCEDDSNKTATFRFNDEVTLILASEMPGKSEMHSSALEFELVSDGENTYFYSRAIPDLDHHNSVGDDLRSQLYPVGVAGMVWYRVSVTEFRSIKVFSGNGTLAADSAINVWYK